jgi:hypothetical protein
MERFILIETAERVYAIYMIGLSLWRRLLSITILDDTIEIIIIVKRIDIH